MEIRKENKVVDFIKKYGVYVAVGVVVFAVALTFTLLATLGSSVPTGSGSLNFISPMSNASVIKDYSDQELQLNETLGHWEAHLSVDLTSENSEVYSILDGTVANIDYDYINGYTITISHADGFASIYSSLEETVDVKEAKKPLVRLHKKSKVKPVCKISTGRRKDAVARVRLVSGTGKITINGRDIDDYFNLETLKLIVRQPLVLTDTNDKYDVIANVYGGGYTGQTGAIRHGIARALVKENEIYKAELKKAGFLSRDSRMKERKKYGLKKARKAPQFSKR